MDYIIIFILLQILFDIEVLKIISRINAERDKRYKEILKVLRDQYRFNRNVIQRFNLLD